MLRSVTIRKQGWSYAVRVLSGRNLHVTSCSRESANSTSSELEKTKPKPPVYSKKGGNFVINALNYVKDVDSYQRQLAATSTPQAKARELIGRIQNNRELLYLLSIFHYELSRIGITNTDSVQQRNSTVWSYRVNWLVKYAKIHNTFWEQCQLQNVAQKDHSLGWHPDRIGILDPRNFDSDVYHDLQRGHLGDVNFEHIQIITFSSPPYQRKEVVTSHQHLRLYEGNYVEKRNQDLTE